MAETRPRTDLERICPILLVFTYLSSPRTVSFLESLLRRTDSRGDALSFATKTDHSIFHFVTEYSIGMMEARINRKKTIPIVMCAFGTIPQKYACIYLRTTCRGNAEKKIGFVEIYCILKKILSVWYYLNNNFVRFQKKNNLGVNSIMTRQLAVYWGFKLKLGDQFKQIMNRK